MKLTEGSDSSKKVIEITLAAVLAAVSIAVAPIATFLPRVPGWGIALFDPVSLFWIVAFLIGGRRVGLITMVAGTFGLFFFDPTIIGPPFKFLATLPMIMLPWFGAKRIGTEPIGKELANKKNYTLFIFAGFLVRLGLMIPLNLIIVPLIFPGFPVIDIIIYALILNSIMTFWDASIPYIVVHGTPVYKNFGMW